jgi:hypothetical protein
LFPRQSTFARQIPTKQIRAETRQRKKTISIAGMLESCLTKTFIMAKKNVASSIFLTPSFSRFVSDSAGFEAVELI